MSLKASDQSDSSNPDPKGEKGRNGNTQAQQRGRELSCFLTARQLKKVKYRFPRPNDNETGTAQMDYEFVRQLQGAKPPTTSHIMNDETRKLREKFNKTTMCFRLPKLLTNPPTYEVDLVSSHKQLLAVLQRDFKMIMCSDDSGLVQTHNWTIKKQIESMGNGVGQAYQPARAVSRTGETTHDVDTSVLRRIFLDDDGPRPEEIGTNFLDIANRSSHRFCPDAIPEVSLVHRIRAISHTGSWSREAHQACSEDDWIILTAGTSASGFHVDYAGYCTVVVGLQGCKYWYTVNGKSEDLWKTFYFNGPRGTEYADGISVTPVKLGVCVIQGPKTIHGVVTPEKAMVAGCFFYTAETFHRSIGCVRLYLEKNIHDNDDISVKQYEELQLCVEHLSLLTSRQRQNVLGEIGFLLKQQRAIKTNVDTMEMTREWKKKPGVTKARRGQGEDVVIKAKNAFLWACLEWWWEEYCDKRRR